MKRREFAYFCITVSLLWAGHTMAIEEAEYTVVLQDEPFEVRDYEPHVLAETRVDGDFEDAGSDAFKRLFKYISGNNQSSAKVAMTAPVAQAAASEKISMTAPVGQQRLDDGWVVSFMMPASYSLETLPEPKDPQVLLRQVPARRMAVVRYSGFWSEKNYLLNKAELESWMSTRKLEAVGVPVWARYNPPFMPWFLRRNEILIPVGAAADSD